MRIAGRKTAGRISCISPDSHRFPNHSEREVDVAPPPRAALTFMAGHTSPIPGRTPPISPVRFHA